jgi:Tfp pilus assembly protein PilV
MRKDAGFSLIAVLTAIVLLSVGLLAVSRASTQMLAMHTTAASRSAALAVARTHMEAVRSQDPATLGSESAVTVNGEGEIDAYGTYTRTVVVDSISHNLKRVRIQVSWPRAEVPVELVTMAFFSVE